MSEMMIGTVATFLFFAFATFFVTEILALRLDQGRALQEMRQDPLFKRERKSVIRKWMDRINAWEQSKRIDARLKQAEIRLNPAELFGFIIVGALFLSILFSSVFHIGYPINILFSVMLVVAFPIVLLFMRRNRRIERLTEQLPDAANLMANATRAGMSLTQSFAFALHDLPEPTRSEFARIHRELQMGTPFEQALGRLGQRVPTSDYRLFIAQLLIQKQAGGNISQSLDELAKTLKDRNTLNAEIRALTAEPRMTATIVSFMPIIFVLFMGMMDPSFVTPLYTSPIGLILFILFLLDIIAAFLITRRFTNIRV